MQSVLEKLTGALDEIAVVILFIGLVVADALLGLGINSELIEDVMWVTIAYLGLGVTRQSVAGQFFSSGVRQASEMLASRRKSQDLEGEGEDEKVQFRTRPMPIDDEGRTFVDLDAAATRTGVNAERLKADLGL